VHANTREIRCPRVVGAFAAGHVVDPTTAKSQLMGGLIWGVSSAVHEATEIDRRPVSGAIPPITRGRLTLGVFPRA